MVLGALLFQVEGRLPCSCLPDPLRLLEGAMGRRHLDLGSVEQVLNGQYLHFGVVLAPAR